MHSVIVSAQESGLPAIAQAAHVQGAVVIAVVIDSAGRVASAKIKSGPQMLREAAVDAVKSWQFAPYQANGVATPVTSA